jgi:hypothetical protein
MTKTKKFFVVVTSLMLVFAMTGCPNSTTSSGSTTPPPSGYAPPTGNTPQPHPFTAASADALNNLLGTVANGTIYVVGNYAAIGDVTLSPGQNLVIADQGFANSQPWPNASVGQLNLGTVNAVSTLTIPAPYTLTVRTGAMLIVGNPETPSQNGVLKILGGGGLTVEEGAALGVTTASRVLVEKPASGAEGGLDLQTGANVYAVGTLAGGLDMISGVPANTIPTALIAVETDAATGFSAPVHVAADVNYYTMVNSEPIPVVGTAKETIDEKVGALYNASPVKEADSADDIAGLFNGGDGVAPAEKVTYTSSEALEGEGGEVSIPPGKTLVIAGEIEGQEDNITVGAGGTLKVEGSLTTSGELTVEGGAALEIAPGAVVTVDGGTLAAEANAVIDIPADATLKVADDGMVDLNELFAPPGGPTPPGTGGTSNGQVALEGELLVAEGGTLRLSMGNGSALPPEIDWTAGGSLKIENGGSVTLADETDVVYIGDDAAALYKWDDEGEGSITLAKGEMILDGKITAATPGGSIGESITATVTEGSEFTVGPWAGAWYAIEGTLVVEKNAKVTVKTHIYTYGKLIVEEGANLQIAIKDGDNLGAVVFIMAGGEVQVEGTITVADGANVGWIELPAETSKLTLLPGGKLDIPATSSIYTKSLDSKSEPRVSAYAVNANGVLGSKTKVKDTDNTNTNWELTKTSDNTSALVPGITVQLGRLKFATEANKTVNNVDGSTDGSAAGTLTAGEDTAIVFLGAEPPSL